MTSLHSSGLNHIDCQYIPSHSTALGLLEGLTTDLMDDPLTRTNPVQRCAKAAKELGYTLFAVSVGYCISGSSDPVDYQYVRSSACNNGIGGYTRGYFSMDIYEIAEHEVVHDFVLDVLHLNSQGATDIHVSALAVEELSGVNLLSPTPQSLPDGDHASSGVEVLFSCTTVCLLAVTSLLLS